MTSARSTEIAYLQKKLEADYVRRVAAIRQNDEWLTLPVMFVRYAYAVLLLSWLRLEIGENER